MKEVPKIPNQDEIIAKIKGYQREIEEAEKEGIKHRWIMGKRILEARGDRPELPVEEFAYLHKEIKRLAAEAGKPAPSILDMLHCMTFAEQYPSEAHVIIAQEKYKNWHTTLRLGVKKAGLLAKAQDIERAEKIAKIEEARKPS